MVENERSKVVTSRCFATILYPESAVSNWMEVLEELHTKVLVSPLHDKDLDKTGALKKPHYHIMLMFSSTKSVAQIREITVALHSVGVEKVLDPVSYAAYLTHLNSPDKAQYSAEDVICFNIDYPTFIAKGLDNSSVVGDIIDFIEQENLRSFASLIQHCRVHQEDWLRCIYGKPYFFSLYLKSRKWTPSETDTIWRNYAALLEKKPSKERIPKSAG